MRTHRSLHPTTAEKLCEPLLTNDISYNALSVIYVEELSCGAVCDFEGSD